MSKSKKIIILKLFNIIFIILFLNILGKIPKIYSWPWSTKSTTSYNKINDIYSSNIFHHKPAFKKDKNSKIEKIYNYDVNANLKGKIDTKKNISEEFKYIYNKEGQLLSKHKIKKFKNKISDQENIEIYETYEYNNKNQLIITRDSKNQIKCKYKYDKQGKLISTTQFYLTNKESHYKVIYTFEYNDQNQKISKIYYKIIRPHPIFKFFNKSKKINEKIRSYEYNEEGQKIQKYNHKTNEKYFYEYYKILPTNSR